LQNDTIAKKEPAMNNRSTPHLVRAVTLAVGLAASPAFALSDTLIDNLSEPERSRTPIITTPFESLWAAQSFATDARRYQLDSIETFLGELVGSPTIVAELREGDSPMGTLLATFSLSIPTGEPEVVTLTPSQVVTLEPSSSYTLVLGIADEGSFTWPYADSNNWLGGGSFGNYHYSDDLGQTWANFGSDFPYFLRVNVTPEACYANCDNSAIAPVLNVNDFTCFLNLYAAGNPAANCDDSTVVPVLNVNDFTCFLNKYAAGCP
jgi:hypothetical protein